jgi:threonine dehydrogenase-like Zn-dependent dehydrogenase
MVAIAVEQPHRLRDDPAEAVGEHDVLVGVRRAGICGSDMHILHGTNPFARYPRIRGRDGAAGQCQVQVMRYVVAPQGIRVILTALHRRVHHHAQGELARLRDRLYRADQDRPC